MLIFWMKIPFLAGKIPVLGVNFTESFPTWGGYPPNSGFAKNKQNKNKLASSVDAIAISKIWNYDPPTDSLTHCFWQCFFFNYWSFPLPNNLKSETRQYFQFMRCSNQTNRILFMGHGYTSFSFLALVGSSLAEDNPDALSPNQAPPPESPIMSASEISTWESEY